MELQGVYRGPGTGDLSLERPQDLDVTDANRVAQTFAEQGPQAVAHLAALSFVPDSFDAPADTFRVNYLGARSVLEAAIGLPQPPRLLLVGSSTIYGEAAPGDPPFDEDAPLRPTSPYA